MNCLVRRFAEALHCLEQREVCLHLFCAVDQKYLTLVLVKLLLFSHLARLDQWACFVKLSRLFEVPCAPKLSVQACGNWRRHEIPLRTLMAFQMLRSCNQTSCCKPNKLGHAHILTGISSAPPGNSFLHEFCDVCCRLHSWPLAVATHLLAPSLVLPYPLVSLLQPSAAKTW